MGATMARRRMDEKKRASVQKEKKEQTEIPEKVSKAKAIKGKK